MKKKLILLLLLACSARAQTNTPAPLSRTNTLKLTWQYPYSGLTTNLGFIIYGTTNLTLPQTNWPVYMTVGVINNYQQAGPFANFAVPIAPTNTALFLTIAASNQTGVTVFMTGTNYPALDPQLLDFAGLNITVTP
jgi:hypothetical protein